MGAFGGTVGLVMRTAVKSGCFALVDMSGNLDHGETMRSSFFSGIVGNTYTDRLSTSADNLDAIVRRSVCTIDA